MTCRDPRFASPLFAPLAHWLDQLQSPPSTVELQSLIQKNPVLLPSGQAVSFTPPQIDGLIYEQRIMHRGQVETRLDNWHDFFNALIWLTFPKTKCALSARHDAAMQPAGQGRNRERDALTHFDECGIVVLATRPDLLQALREFRWQDLFVHHRAAVQSQMRFLVFGHATYEHLLQPYHGLTAKGMLYEVDEHTLNQPPEALNLTVDQLLSSDFSQGALTDPKELQPLPVLGIPGVTLESENPAYYSDRQHFRPGRKTPPTSPQ